MCFGCLHAQNTFYLEFDDPYSNSPYDILEISDGYVICGVSDVYASSEQNSFLMKIDFQGNVVWNLVLDYAHVDYFNSIVDVGDGILAGGRAWQGGVTENKNLLTKFDYSGAELWTIYPGDSAVLAYDNIINDMLVVEDGVLIASSGFDSSSGTTNANLIKIDPNGTEMWSQYYGSDLSEQRIDQLQKIEKLETGYLLKMSSTNQSNDPFTHAVFVDDNGVEIGRKSLQSYQPLTISCDSLIYFKDICAFENDHYLALYTQDDVESYTSELILLEFDGNGNEIRGKIFESSEAISKVSLSMIPFQGIYLIGEQDLDTFDQRFIQMFAAKLSADWQLNWLEHYGNKDTSEIQFSGIVTSDEGVLIGGRILNTTAPPYGFNSVLVKTDCRGSLKWNAESCLSPMTNDVLIFPNPFEGKVNIHLPNVPKENSININIYDLGGRLTDQFSFEDTRVIQLNTASYSIGFYVIQVFIDETLYHTEKVIKH